MEILRNPFDAGRRYPHSVLTLGKFDALHLGHQALLREVLRLARSAGVPALAVTFDPAPDQHLRLFPSRPVLPLAERLRLLGSSGLDAVVLLVFDADLACLSPEAFARNVLAHQLRPSAVVVGEDFCFGKDRQGKVTTLSGLGDRFGFTVHSVPLASDAGEKISATRIRSLLRRGERAEAERLLGRPLD